MYTKIRLKLTNGAIYYTGGRRGVYKIMPDKHIKGKMSRSLTWKAGSFIDIR